LYARALLQDGDAAGAERALQEATTRFPIEPQALLLYASTAEKLGHAEAARTALIQYGALTASDADLAARAAQIATLSLRLNDPRTAVHWLSRAIAASPNDARLLASLAEAQIRAGDRDAAQATIAHGLEKDPGSAALLAVAQRRQLRTRN